MSPFKWSSNLFQTSWTLSTPSRPVPRLLGSEYENVAESESEYVKYSSPRRDPKLKKRTNRLNLTRLRKIFPWGRKLTFGVWIRWTVDNIAESAENTQWRSFSHYRPLESGEHIRVLRLRAGKGSEPLRVELEHQNLAENPDYEALSYTWGNSWKNRPTLEVNGHEIDVGENLEGALRRLRLPDADRFIWAEAICINQQDYREKAQQVGKMLDIYAKAKGVVAWLGKETEDSGAGMQIIRFFVDENTKPSDAPWYLMSPELSAKGLQDILGREWWYRIWTVQEPAVAQSINLICGRHECSWPCNIKSLKKIIYKIKSASVSPRWNEANLGEIEMRPVLETVELQLRELASKQNIKLEKDLLDVVYEFRHRKATDPRDKIFAVLGLADGQRINMHTRPTYSADYTESITMAQARFDRIIREQYGFFEEDEKKPKLLENAHLSNHMESINEVAEEL